MHVNVLIVGANGQIGTQVVDLLKDSDKHTPVAMVRKEEQVEEFKEKGVQTVLVDLESSVEELESAMDNMDAVVFTAGSGGSTGYDKTLLIDLDGAVKVMEAAKAKGVDRFVMVSAFGADNRDYWNESIKPYYVAKHYADLYLEGSGLTYTIVRPGALTNDEGTGKVRLEEAIRSGDNFDIPRADVARLLVETLDTEAAYNKAFDVVGGDTSIKEALKSI
ncbi:SDR family oxidoreductase [Atopococcus tabaci]|uniref:SDR family oxidoreductase n=1 Tax=Atopococcus tabaci TaxID=269774 RepID=UPI001F0B6535|nr:SDR family oxidoreductase [Atopococcus tabaci]